MSDEQLRQSLQRIVGPVQQQAEVLDFAVSRLRSDSLPTALMRGTASRCRSWRSGAAAGGRIHLLMHRVRRAVRATPWPMLQAARHGVRRTSPRAHGPLRGPR